MATRPTAPLCAIYICLLGLAAACTKPQSDAGPSVNLPAASSASAAASAPPSPRPIAPTGTLSLFRGSLVDEKGLTAATLATGDVVANALGPRTAYVTVGRAAPRELRAFSTASHAASWAVPTQGCTTMAAVAGGVYCDDPSGLLFFDERTGASTTVSSRGSVSQLLPVGSRLLVLRDDHTLEALDLATHASVRTLVLPQRPAYFGPGRTALVVSGAQACGVIFELGVVAFCVDERLDYAWKKPLTLPYAWFQQLDPDFIVLAALNAPAEHAIVLRTRDGAVLYDGPEHVAAAVPRSDHGLEGLLVTTPATRFLSPAGAVLWASQEKLESAASAVVQGEALIVASHHPNATGASLLAFDRTTGATLWHGELEMLSIAHSKYSNHVNVSLSEGHVRVAGVESSQEYVQLFDPRDGKRLLSLISYR